MRHSGHSLVRKATDRGIRRAADQLLAVIREEREALRRPVEESEQRIAKLRETIADGESAMRDLDALLASEQQRLSQVFVGRREVFLKQTRALAQKELAERLRSMAHRRATMGLPIVVISTTWRRKLSVRSSHNGLKAKRSTLKSYFARHPSGSLNTETVCCAAWPKPGYPAWNRFPKNLVENKSASAVALLFSCAGKCGCTCFSFPVGLRSRAWRSGVAGRDRPRCATFRRSPS